MLWERVGLTARLDHQAEVPGDGRLEEEHEHGHPHPPHLNPQGEGHHREGDGASPLAGHPGHGGPAHHGDGQQVALGEVAEVVVPDGLAPPAGLKEDEWNEDSWRSRKGRMGHLSVSCV